MSAFEVLFGFDMETDIGSGTSAHDGLIHGTPRVLDLMARHGVTGTFYFVGASARAVPGSVRSVCDAGHEVGAHSLHHETVGDPLFPVPGAHPLLPEELLPRLERNTQWVEEVAGVRPVSFRAPRLFGSTALCNALEQLGYVSDASYPFYRFRERLEPYHPDAAEWTRPGGLRLVEIPNFADPDEGPGGHPPGRRGDQWPRFRTESPAAVLGMVDRFLAHLERNGVRRKVVAFYFHPWEFHPMPEGEIASAEGTLRPAPWIVRHCGEKALEALEALITGLKARGAGFRTAAEIAAATPPAS